MVLGRNEQRLFASEHSARPVRLRPVCEEDCSSVLLRRGFIERKASSRNHEVVSDCAKEIAAAAVRTMVWTRGILLVAPAIRVPATDRSTSIVQGSSWGRDSYGFLFREQC